MEMPGAVAILDDDVEVSAALRDFLSSHHSDTVVVHLSSLADFKDYIQGTGRFSDRAKTPHPKIVFMSPQVKDGKTKALIPGLKSQFRDEILLVTMTTDLTTRSIEEIYHSGSNTFLSKPVKLDDLIRLRDFYFRFFR